MFVTTRRGLITMAVLPPDPVFCMRANDIGAVNCICFHSTERLFSGTAKGAVYLWDMQVLHNNFFLSLSN